MPGLLTTSPSPLSPLDSCSSPPIALFHPRLIWQPGRRRAGSESHRGTLLIFKHHTHASFLLPPPPPPPPLSRHLVSLLCPRLSLLPARSRSSSPQFCLRFNFLPASLAFLTLRSRAHNPGDARHLVIFVLRSASFCLNLNSSDLNVFFFFHLNVFHI